MHQAAAAAAPGHGKVHNQLAVLALQREDAHAAVFHYMRALAVPHPIPTAREALNHIFDKVPRHGAGQAERAAGAGQAAGRASEVGSAAATRGTSPAHCARA